MLPSFLIIGAMKAGTTSLHAYLDQHPGVFMSEPKELDFFVEGKNWERGLSWYEAHFDGAEGYRAVGEASPSYSQANVFPGVPARIVSLLPKVRVVYLVRHPIERMRSMYLHQVASGREHRPSDVALRDDRQYLDASRYSWQIDRYLEHLAADRILVLTSESLRNDRVATLGRVLAFLEVGGDVPFVAVDEERGRTEQKRVPRPVLRRLQRTPLRRLAPARVRRQARRLGTRRIDPGLGVISPVVEAELRDRLAPDVAGLRRFLGEDFDGWGIG